MAGEKTRAKYVVGGIDFADVITSAAGLATAEWDPQPLTLRDDAIEIIEGDPTEDEIFSHEVDAPVDYDIAGVGLTARGSFIGATVDQLVSLLGGAASGVQFQKSASKVVFEKAIRFRFKNGGYLILPRGRGYALLNINASRNDGRTKFPFVIRGLAPDSWDCDSVLDLSADAIPAG